MHKKPKTIIGINQGTRSLGISVFKGIDIRDWRIKIFQEKWSKKKMERIMSMVSALIEKYKPDVIALKKLHPSRVSRPLNRITDQILEYSEINNIKVYKYSIKEMENYFSPDKRISKENMAEIVVSKYPELFHELKKENKNYNAYYIRMFEGVALGSICSQQLDNH